MSRYPANAVLFFGLSLPAIFGIGGAIAILNMDKYYEGDSKYR